MNITQWWGIVVITFIYLYIRSSLQHPSAKEPFRYYHVCIIIVFTKELRKKKAFDNKCQNGINCWFRIFFYFKSFESVWFWMCNVKVCTFSFCRAFAFAFLCSLCICLTANPLIPKRGYSHVLKGLKGKWLIWSEVDCYNYLRVTISNFIKFCLAIKQ